MAEEAAAVEQERAVAAVAVAEKEEAEAVEVRAPPRGPTPTHQPGCFCTSRCADLEFRVPKQNAGGGRRAARAPGGGGRGGVRGPVGGGGGGGRRCDGGAPSAPARPNPYRTARGTGGVAFF